MELQTKTRRGPGPSVGVLYSVRANWVRSWSRSDTTAPASWPYGVPGGSVGSGSDSPWPYRSYVRRVGVGLPARVRESMRWDIASDQAARCSMRPLRKTTRTSERGLYSPGGVEE